MRFAVDQDDTENHAKEEIENPCVHKGKVRRRENIEGSRLFSINFLAIWFICYSFHVKKAQLSILLVYNICELGLC